jgi:hypothetical protein
LVARCRFGRTGAYHSPPEISLFQADPIVTAPLQDCDMPQNLQTPETRPEGGVDEVDVMNFLGINRPESLKAHHDEDDQMP